MARRVVFMLLVLASLVQADTYKRDELSVPWPVPAGFRKETIKFPLDFAPTLVYKGVEELRFCPGFSKSEAADFFSYAFIWQIDDVVSIDAARLKADFTTYFAGLMAAVAKDKSLRLPTSVEAAAVKDPKGWDRPSYTADISTWDAFFTKRALKLQLRMFEPACQAAGEHYQKLYYFEVSPHLDDPTVARDFANLRAQLSP